MSEMKMKENGGTSPVDLSRGFEKLDGDPPHSGENILDPEHVAEERVLAKWRKENLDGFPEEENGPEGFLHREDVPWRDKRNDDRG